MENLANNGGGESSPPNIPVGLEPEPPNPGQNSDASNDLEKDSNSQSGISHLATNVDHTSQDIAALIRNSFGIFESTNDIDYLHSAIAIAEELAFTDRGILPLLDHMLEVRNAQGEEPVQVGLVNDSYVQSDAEVEDTQQDGVSTPTIYPSGMNHGFVDNPNPTERVMELDSENVKTTPDFDGIPEILDVETEGQWYSGNLKEELLEEVGFFASDPPSPVLLQAMDTSTEYQEAQDIVLKHLSAFLETGETRYLDNASEMIEDAVGLAISEREVQSSRLLMAGISEYRYSKTESLEDIGMVIRELEEAIPTVPQSDPDRVVLVQTLVAKYRSRYKQLGDPHDLEQITKWTQDGVTAKLLSDPGPTTTSTNLEDSAQGQFNQAEVLGDLGQVTKEVERVSTPVSKDGLPQASRLLFQGSTLLKRYLRLGDPDDLQMAIQLNEQAVMETPSDNRYWPAMSIDLASKIFLRYKLNKDLGDLQKAITQAERALSATSVDEPGRSSICNNLGEMLRARYDDLNDLEDLEQAIRMAEEVVAAASSDEPNRDTMLSLSVMFQTRYERLGLIEDLNQSIKWIEELIPQFPSENTSVDIANLLRGKLWMRYEKLRERDDLERNIKLAEEAVTATPSGSLDRATMCSLSIMFRERYRLSEDIEDLEQSIKWAKQAVAATPSEDSDQIAMSTNLGVLLNLRYERLGELDDLNNGIKWYDKAVAATTSDNPDREAMANLGRALLTRYRQLGELADLDQYIKLTEEVVELASSQGPDSAVMYDLGVMFHVRYGRLGAIDDLEQAIKWIKRALSVVSSGDTAETDKYWSLARMLYTKYNQLGAVEDLVQSTKLAETAINVAPSTHSENSPRSCVMSNMLIAKYDRLGDPEDLEQAIKSAEAGVAVLPSGHQDRAVRYSTMGRVLLRKYQREGDLEDLERAMRWTGDAVAEIPLTHPQRATVSGSLSAMFLTKYMLLRSPRELEEAIKWAEEAVTIMSRDDPSRASALLRLGVVLEISLEVPEERRQPASNTSDAVVALPDYPDREIRLAPPRSQNRHQNTYSIQTFNYLLHVLYEAWHCQLSPLHLRIIAARKAAYHLAGKKRWQESCSLLEGAVKVLPNVSPNSLKRNDREYHLSESTLLTAETVSVALQAGEEAAYCLRLLEHGRGTILGSVIDCRSDLSDLQLKYPEFFKKFHSLRTQADSPFHSASEEVEEVEETDTSSQQNRRNRERLVEELEETLASIRDLPGFEGFHLPPRSADLMAMANEGPIVVFNSTELRSDAIIVTSASIDVLPLPKLLYSSAKARMEQISQLTHGTRKTYQWRNKQMEELLLWLWDVAVEPALQALNIFGSAKPSSGDLPRIWWIGVGPLAMAPFHAAGDHSRRSTRNTLSRVISSYTPTTKALSYAREKKLELLGKPPSEPRLLLVNMPNTPNHTPLKNSTLEVENVATILNEKVHTTRLDNPTAAQVLAEIPSYQAIHFACHSISVSKEPSKSHLLLGSESGDEDRLTVEAISNSNIKQAQIAYLSACSTAQNTSVALADESIFIASGFQLAGFSHVLATQWVSNDKACEQVASDFYRSLFSGDEKDGGHRKVSTAFHYAVKRLRDENLRQPILWAPFIHTGA